jgi:alkyl hydroperoxide reductase subunit AhpF
VPTVFLNGKHFGQGRMSLEESWQDRHRRERREAEKIAAKDPSTC